MVLPLLLPLTAVVPAEAVGRAPAAAPSPAAAPADEIDIVPPTIAWSACEEYEDAECAVVRLPLDYDNPDGPKTPVKLLRKKATGDRIGSLFVNPGGPGGSAYDFAAYAGDLIGPGISRRFDVIGVEPRGIGYNQPATCTVARGEEPSYPPVGYPFPGKQTKRWIRADNKFNRACRAKRSVITDHMSTADYARDIDVVRQAVGDEQLTFYGISYGSIVGQTYAAMFPDRVRAVVVDGVLDPVAWTSGGRKAGQPSTYRLGSGEGAYEALVSAFDECDRVGKTRCAVSGRAKEIWKRLYRRAKRGDLVIDGGRVRPQDLVGNALGALYSAYGVRYLMRFLRAADRRSDTAGSGTSRVAGSWDELERIREKREAVGPYGAGRPPLQQPGLGRWGVGFPAVLCSDAVNPDNPRAWARYSRRADRTQPWFGRLWTWAGSLCARWPGTGGQDAYRGPWNVSTSTPLLVVGNTHDPATPIRGARAANRHFEDSVLLTLDAWGHGALGSSRCAARKMAAYLIEQRLPRPSTWCLPDRPLFR